jgi:hypothetical protein
VLVAIPSGTPVGSKGLPDPMTLSAAPAAASAVPAAAPATHPDQFLATPVVTRTPPPTRAGNESGSNWKPTPRPPASPASPARTDTMAAPEPASLHQALASLSGPFMTFEQCEVRFASAVRAIARCLGHHTDAAPGGSPSQPRRVEWTLDFDRAERRWLIVDATAR